MSLSTGFIADKSMNCDNVVEIGQKAVSELAGKKFLDFKLRCNDKMKTIDAKNTTVKVRGQNMEVNPIE